MAQVRKLDGVCAHHTVYGLQLQGPAIAGLSAYLLPAAGVAGPRVVVRHEVKPPPLGASRSVDDSAALLDLPEGRWLRLDRATAEAVYSGPPLSPDQLAHPYLGPLAIMFNRWLGREVFHAGAFVADGLAWVVVGPREAGKSSLLAAIAATGTVLLADDISVTDGDQVFAGPRCLDLREPVPGSNGSLVRARDDTRWRMSLPVGAASCPLGGWLFLRWGEGLSLTPVAPPKLLRRLARHRLRTHLQSDPAILLALANRPAWLVTRPRSWDSVGATISSIMTAVSEPPRSIAEVG